MGGTVSLSVALQYPDRVSKVTIIGSPVIGSSLALPLKLAGFRPIAWLLFTMFPTFRSAMRIASPFICSDPRFPDMMDRDLSKTTLESFLVSIASLRKTDLSPYVHQIGVPTLGMFGDKDNIVDPNQGKALEQGLPTARIERFDRAGHFIMLDEPQLLMRNLKDFLDTPEETVL
jgi:pimeloyl-ACP methyl ester carboxylesterase